MALFNINSITPTFSVNGVQLHVTGGRRERPAGRPGATLSVTLADDLDPETLVNQPCDLRVTVGNTAGLQGRVVFKGRVAGYTRRVGAQQGDGGAVLDDAVELQCISMIADRWSRAPERLVSMYDPERLSGDDLKFDTSVLPTKEDGTVLTPQMVSTRDLTAHAAIRYAAKQMQYLEVIFTAEDYPVQRVDFTPASGWYSPISDLLKHSEPIWVDDEDRNVLYILDPYTPLPEGFPITDKTLSQMQLNLSQPTRDIVNQAEVVFRNDGEYEVSRGRQFTRERFAQVIVNAGNNVSSRIDQWFRDFFDAGSGRLLSSVQTRQRTFTYAGTELTIEDQVDYYTGGIRTGYLKTTQQDVPGFVFSITREEKFQVGFTRNYLGYRQEYTAKSTSGLFVKADQDGREIKVPVDDAVRSGLIYDGGTFDFDFASIASETEVARRITSGQFDVITTEVDHLTSSIRSHTASRTGEPVIYNKALRAGTQGTTVIEHAASIAAHGRRIAPQFDAGELPYKAAISAAKKWLARQNEAPREASVDFPDPDFQLRRGSVLRLHDRGGAVGVFVVVGDSVSWSSAQPMAQAVTLREVLLSA